MAILKKESKAKKSVKKISVKKPAAKKSTKKIAAKKKAKLVQKLSPKKTLVKKPVAKKPAPPKLAVKKLAVKSKPETMEPKGPPGFSEQLRDTALKVLDDRQAEDIVTVNLTGRSAMADYMIIASGRASKQLGAIAHYLREEFSKLGVTSMRMEGLSEGNWVLMDAGDIVVHLFRPEVRRYYNLEQIWDRSGRPQKHERDSAGDGNGESENSAEQHSQ